MFNTTQLVWPMSLLRYHAKVLSVQHNSTCVTTDALASEVLIAGGDRLAEPLSDLMERVAASGTDPPQWKGGTLARLYKFNSDAPDCNTHRGLLIADHVSNVFTSLLLPPIARVCDVRPPTEHRGCVRGRGTAREMHTSRQCFVGSCWATVTLSTALVKETKHANVGRSVVCRTVL